MQRGRQPPCQTAFCAHVSVLLRPSKNSREDHTYWLGLLISTDWPLVCTDLGNPQFSVVIRYVKYSDQRLQRTEEIRKTLLFPEFAPRVFLVTSSA